MAGEKKEKQISDLERLFNAGATIQGDWEGDTPNPRPVVRMREMSINMFGPVAKTLLEAIMETGDGDVDDISMKEIGQIIITNSDRLINTINDCCDIDILELPIDYFPLLTMSFVTMNFGGGKIKNWEALIGMVKEMFKGVTPVRK